MVQILLLVPFVLWLSWVPTGTAEEVRPWMTVAFFWFYVLLILTIRVWSVNLAHRVRRGDFSAKLRRYNLVVHWAKIVIPLWFAFGLWGLGWGWTARKWLGPVGGSHWESPQVLMGTLPAILAWVSMWWAQYPADTALKERNMLYAVNDNLPIHPPPKFRDFFFSNFRLQVLFLLLPVLLILFLRDVTSAILAAAGVVRPMNDWIEAGIALVSAGTVFIGSPWLLTRILKTHPLPSSPLRDRLEHMCKRAGLRYREILLWQTHHHMGNAAVMGIIPQLRYILMTDLLLETMTDEQIEAVFAHEAGHIVHRHMFWYVMFFMTFSLALVAPGNWVDAQLKGWDHQEELVGLLGGVFGFALLFFIFGYLSRRFERQADVYAARTMQLERSENKERSPFAESVGPAGTVVFVSALNKVAAINNIPIEARNWSHGSIATRMDYLESIAQEPEKTWQFDKTMRQVCIGLLIALVLSGGIATWDTLRREKSVQRNNQANGQSTANPR